MGQYQGYYVGIRFIPNTDHVEIYIEHPKCRQLLLTVLNACGTNQQYTTDLLVRLRCEFARMSKNLKVLS